MADLPNLGPHANGTLLELDQDQAEDTSNDLDSLLDNAMNAVGSVDCTAGGTITVSDDVYFGSGTIKLTGSPASAFTLNIPNNDRDIKIWNTSGETATIDTVTGSAKTPVLEDGNKVRLQVDATEIEVTSTFNTVFHNLSIMSLREIASDEIDVDANHGGILTSDSTPRLKRVSTSTDKALKVEWIGGNVDEVQFDPWLMPADLDSDENLIIHLIAKMDAGGDTPTIDVQVFDGIGDTEMGGATAALSSTLADLTVTITAANLSGSPLGFLNISLIPGTHATQLVELYAAKIEYIRK